MKQIAYFVKFLEQVPASLEQHLIGLEKALHLPEVRGSPKVDELLADGFIEIGRSGKRYSKPEIIEALKSEELNSVVAGEFVARHLAPGCVLLTYRTEQSGSPPKISLRSSIWSEQSGAWQMLFHQGTPSNS